MTETNEMNTPIHTYSRFRAIADGVLVDADSLEEDFAKQAGFKVPVALTAGAWADTVAWSETVEEMKPHGTGQDEKGRLWDVLTMARYAASRTDGTERRLTFQVLRIPAEGRRTTPTLADLVMEIGPGDLGEPVMTIMLPHED